MAKLQLQALTKQKDLHIIVDSHDGCIYQAMLNNNGEEQLIWADSDTPIKARSLTEMRQLLEHLELASIHLRQSSPYDEMIGGPDKADNTLLIPLSKNHWQQENQQYRLD